MSILSNDKTGHTLFRSRVDENLPWLLSIPVALLYVLFLGIPILLLVSLSFSGANPISNFIAVFTNPSYRNALVLSIGISIFVTVLSTVLGLFMAYFIGRREFPGKRVIVAIMSFPISLPGILVAWAVIVMIGRTGVITQLITMITGADPSTYSSAFGLVGLLVGYIYFTLPRTTMALVSSVEKLDQNLEEAATSLGASKLETFRYVTLPAIAPGIGSAVVLSFSVCMAAFGTALLLASGEVNILPLKIYSIVLGTYEYDVAAALGIVLTTITVGVIYGYSQVVGGNVYE